VKGRGSRSSWRNAVTTTTGRPTRSSANAVVKSQSGKERRSMNRSAASRTAYEAPR
jgi:hypothetical protein